MIRYRVAKVSGRWTVYYRYTPTSEWFSIASYRFWKDAVDHAFTDAKYAYHRRLKLNLNSTYGE